MLEEIGPPCEIKILTIRDRIYQLILEGKTNAVLLPSSDGETGPAKRDRRFGPKGRRPRQAEKAVKLCARAWDVVRRLYPDLFDHEVPNPWRGVALGRRTKRVKSAATREEVYIFAETAIAAGYPEVGAAAVICFEWLQRPENVLAGHIRWTDYRGRDAPSAIRITHHKTGAVVLHSLDDPDGTHFYADAEAVLAKVPRRGVPIVMHDARGKTEDGKAKPAAPYSASGMAKLVQRLRQVAKLSQTFSLEACRHGGMTEREEAELTDGAPGTHLEGIRRLREAHHDARARRDQEAPRAPAGNSQCERHGNRISEWAAQRVSG